MTISKIVVGVDFSDQSQVAVEQALEIARTTGASLTLLHCGVVPDEIDVPESMRSTAEAFLGRLNEQVEHDRTKLHALRERYMGQGVEISHMVMDGFADSKLAEAAKDLGADLVVVGTHGRTGIKRFLLGSVAERTTRLTETNVLVARAGDAAGRGGFDNILVPTDFSENSERALQMAVSLARPGTNVTVLHCWTVPPLTGATSASMRAAREIYEPIRTSMLAQAQKKGLDMLNRASQDGVEFNFRQVEATPADGIQHWLSENDCGLVVMGSHGRRGLRRFILGSVAELTVRHSDCSVMIVHGGETA